MNLPVRIQLTAPTTPVILVDGVFEAPGLQLSHWPGNRTPADLRHDLSSGCALAFARLAPAERERRAAGATAIVNNHYDTDGCLAAFAVRHPAAALARAEPLLAAAAAGDFYRVADERAFALDQIVTHFVEPERSPLGSELAGLDREARYTRAQNALLELLPGLLDGELDPHRALFEAELATYRADGARLAACTRVEEPQHDLCTWIAPAQEAAREFDPGRHALFTASHADRALVLAQDERGVACRLVVSTRSWFDLVSERRLPRPDLEALARRLNEAEGARPDAPHAWRAQSASNASPELWFGGVEVEPFAEHNGKLGRSRLGLAAVRAALRAALSGAHA